MPIPEGNPVTIQDGSGTTNNQAVVTAAGAMKVDASAAGGGTVTANQGTAAAVAGAWPVKLTDAVNGTVQVIGSARTTSLVTVQGFVGSILSGSQTADAGTIITIGPNLGFVGQVLISATELAAATATPNVTVQGAGSTPASGTKIAQLSLTGTATQPAADTAVINVYILAPAAGCTLQLNLGGATAASASVNGYTL